MAVSTQTSRIFSAGTDVYDAPIQDCPNCGTRVDVTRYEPLQAINCPGCNGSFQVKGSIDRFNLENIAGKGGTGLVYQAFDPHLGRKVALKVVRPDKVADEDVLHQMAAEAGITANINHPNVVRVYSAAKVTGRFFIAMEIIGGGSLDDLMTKKGRLPEAQVLDIAIQVASGLQAAHNAGLVHRDIKPGNILFADAKTAKIVDFGLATVEQHNAGTNEVWGTPYYMPPERLQGEPEDFRSDIYALGGTLFHALAGRPPFEAKDPAQVAMKRLHAPAPSVLTFAPGTSNAMAFVLKKMLERDPSVRFQSYEELIESLQFARNELASQTAAAPSRVVVDSEQGGRSAMWVTVAALGVILVGGIGAFMFLSKKTPETTGETAAVAETPAAETKAEPPKVVNADAPALGVYYVANRGTDKTLACMNASLDNSIPIGVLPKSDSALQQRWIIRTYADGTSAFYAFHSFKSIDIRSNSTDDNAAINAWHPNGSPAQRWRFREVQPGWSAIFSENSKKALTAVPDGNGGMKVAQRDYSGAPEQQWRVEQVGTVPPELTGMDPVLNPNKTGMPPTNVRTLLGPVNPRFAPLDISNVVIADSRRGIFGSPEDLRAAVQPLLRGMVEVNGVPFDILDPVKHPRGRDQIVLKGGNTPMSTSNPQKVEIAAPKVAISKVHVIGGHAGWGFPYGNGARFGAIIGKIVVHFEGGEKEEFFLRNGVEYTDHVTSPAVPGAALIPGFASGNNQLRYFQKSVQGTAPVEKIVLESMGTQVAPAFVSLTVEKRQ